MLNWNWNRKQGVLEYDTHIADLYDGNCLLIALYRKKELDDGNWEYWTPPLFWNDDVHAKRVLGLVKGYDDMFEGLDIKVTLYRDMWDKAAMKKVIGLLSQRKGNTTIEIRESE